MKKEIHFLWESEKKIKVSQAGQEGSFFYESYRQALAGVAEIVRASTVYAAPGHSDPFFPQRRSDFEQEYNQASQNDKYLYNYPNNMIVFSGDRGAGKSSAMLTFVSSLQDLGSKLYEDTFLGEMTARELPGVDTRSVSAMLHNCEFVTIPPIDPTTLENSDQILTVILARMFQLAMDTWNSRENKLPRTVEQEEINTKNILMKQFSTCYEHVNAIKNWDKKHSEYEGLDVLADLGDASRLKREFTSLVGNLLKFTCLNSPRDPYLIIQIDDTDMNIQQAYTILEDIRKYLVIPRVIIVMAANLSHLIKVVESSLLDSYHNKLSESAEYASHISQQYITKLFPQTRQVILPDLGTYFKEHADNIEVWYKTPNKTILPEDDASFPDVQEQIFRLIYKKTGLVFLKHRNRLHYIIPGNMRLHAHFLAMLIQMENVEDPNKETPDFFLEPTADAKAICAHREKLRTRLQNIQRFRDYFLSTWITNNLNGECTRLISELEKIDISKKVRFVCKQLWRKCVDATSNEKLSEDRCSYADMIQLCRHLEREALNEGESRFIFAIETYFSLLGHSIVLEELIEFYDRDGESNINDLGCSFDRLYPLYGSRLFPYSDQIGCMSKEGSGWNEYYVELNETGGDPKSRISLISRWRTQAGSIPTHPVLQGSASLLYCMFSDYAPEGNKPELPMDLCSLITNCLYICKKQDLEMSPQVKAICGIGAIRTTETEDAAWRSVRNSALLTVLNWDLQSKIGHTLQDLSKQAVQADKGNLKIKYAGWSGALANFYAAIVLRLKTSDSGTQPAIAALGKMQFSGWFEQLFMQTADSDQTIVDKLGEWYTSVSELNPFIDCSEEIADLTKPENSSKEDLSNPGETPKMEPNSKPAVQEEPHAEGENTLPEEEEREKTAPVETSEMENLKNPAPEGESGSGGDT